MFLEIFNFHTIGHQRGGGGGYSASRSLEPRPSSPFMPTSKESRQNIQNGHNALSCPSMVFIRCIHYFCIIILAEIALHQFLSNEVPTSVVSC